MEALLETSNAENASLRKAMEFKDSQINSLLLKTNSLEQYNRSWSIRVNGLAISSEEEKDSSLVKKKVFDNLLLPILAAAVESGDLPLYDYTIACTTLIEWRVILTTLI